MINNDLTATGKAAFVKSVMSPANTAHPASNAYDGVISSVADKTKGLGTRAISAIGLATAAAYFEGTFNGCKKITSFDIYAADASVATPIVAILTTLDKASVYVGTNPCLLTIAAGTINTPGTAYKVICTAAGAIAGTATPAYGTSIKITKDITGAVL